MSLITFGKFLAIIYSGITAISLFFFWDSLNAYIGFFEDEPLIS